MNKYLGLFTSEAGEHLARMGAELVNLERVARDGDDTAPVVDGLFRHAHSVKGMAASMGFEGIAALAHRAEDLVAVYRGRGAHPAAESVDALLASVDALSALVQRAASGTAPADLTADPALLDRLGAEAERARSSEAPAAPAPAAPAPAPAPSGPAEQRVNWDAFPVPAPAGARSLAVEVEVAPACAVPAVRGFLVLQKLARLGTVVNASPNAGDLRAGRIPGGKLAVTLLTAAPVAEVERALAAISDLARAVVTEGGGAPAPKEPASPLPAPGPPATTTEDAARTVRLKVERLDAFLDAVGELILATAHLRELGRALPPEHRAAIDEGVDRLHVTVKDLHDGVMAVRMTPLALVTERLPRTARDLARRTGKQVELTVRGADIEIDRSLLDEIADSLLHVVRNAVDHGLEQPHLRLLAGKSATGHVTVNARRERDRVVIEIADDGKGMDAARLRAAAVARGALAAEEAAALSDGDALLLACLPGVSTAQAVTDVSGRGVGLDAVKRTVEGLGGALEVASTPGAGTRFTLRLPLTVAVQGVLLVHVGEEVLGLPIAKVRGAARVDLAALDRSEGAPVLAYGGRLVPVRELRALLGFPRASEGGPRAVVVTDGDGAWVGLAVDSLVGQDEAVLKPLVRPLDLVDGLSAVTVLGNGRPVFILDVPRLVAA